MKGNIPMTRYGIAVLWLVSSAPAQHADPEVPGVTQVSRPESPFLGHMQEPDSPGKACGALITCESPGTLLEQGGRSSLGCGHYVAANEHYVFVSDPEENAPPIRVFEHDSGMWRLRAQIAAGFFTGSTSNRGRERLAASGNLLVATSHLLTTIVQCDPVFCETIGGIDSGGSALATNGQEVVIGWPFDLCQPSNTCRQIWVYARNHGEWLRTQEILAPIGSGPCGRGLAMDKQRIAVSGCGKTHVYLRNGPDWSLEQEIPVTANALAINGETLIIGGAFYAFINGTWQPALRQAIYNVTPQSDFGYTVALPQPDLAVISALSQPYEYYYELGAVHVLRQFGSFWIPIRTILPPYRANGTHFGRAITTFGSNAIIAAPFRYCGGSCDGQVYSFPLTGADCDCDHVADACELDEDRDGVAGCDGCPTSILDALLQNGACTTDVPNRVLDEGCSMADLIAGCNDLASDSRQKARCVDELASDWRRQGLVDFDGANQIRRCFSR